MPAGKATALTQFDASKARLPETYEAARKALAECSRIDECLPGDVIECSDGERAFTIVAESVAERTVTGTDETGVVRTVPRRWARVRPREG